MRDTKTEAKSILNKWERYESYLDERYRMPDEPDLTIHEEFLNYIGNYLFTDMALVKEICEQGSNFLETNDIKIAAFCSEELRNSRSTALAMIKSNGSNLELISDKFKDDKGFILESLQHNNILAYVSERLKDDDEVVQLAVKKNPKAIAFVSDRYKKNEYFILDLLQKDNYLIEYMHKDLTSNIEFLSKCWKILNDRSGDSAMIMHAHAKTLIRHISNDLKPLFNNVYLDGINDHLNEQMNAGFNKYLLNKELKKELKTSDKHQDKKLKL
jgi:hypothetical protein